MLNGKTFVPLRLYKPLNIENKMRKLFTLFALCLGAFGFVGCNDKDDEKIVELQETTRYRLEVCTNDFEDSSLIVEGILIFGKEKSSFAEDNYFNTEANIELGVFDYKVFSPWRELKGVMYMEVLYKIKDRYFGVEYYVQKNTDNNICLNQKNEISEQTYLQCKSYYEEHAY